ncbi:MAG: hypothetical protein PVG66_03085 [Chromatiales bacterium]|jgi:hypothetical protein
MNKQYIMQDQAKNAVNSIMQYDLTWRQKKATTSMHLSIIAGLSVISFLSQLI